ncbi:transcription elongation factor GreA [Aureimonas ureilytica]|uniref:transcription elongation factor GreA n=1 Tax=Aureimonas ureilytica TaxID=401562 RepID=UPI00037165E8|nr:transcription elongation factor GreA [Aureimonas ureilytica]
MSVAFVKEPNENQVETLPDRELGTDPNFVTAKGLKQIEDQVADLEAKLFAARDADDKIGYASVHRDLRYWRARKMSAELVPAPDDAETVHFGSEVTIERDDGRAQVFCIVGIDEANPADGRLSYLSPLAKAIAGKSVGDVVKVGPSEAEIVEIKPIG